MNKSFLLLCLLLSVTFAFTVANDGKHNNKVIVEKQSARLLTKVKTLANSTVKPNGTKTKKVGGANDSNMIIFVTGAIGILFAFFQNYLVMSIPLTLTRVKGNSSLQNNFQERNNLLANGTDYDDNLEMKTLELRSIFDTIREGASAFLWAEYKICFLFIVLFGALVLGLVAKGSDMQQGTLTALSFAIGGLTSIFSGYIGMMVAVNSNARCTVSANKIGADGWRESFNAAFRAGSVMGFSLCGVSLIVLYILCLFYKTAFTDAKGNVSYKDLFECIAGYGLGGSSIAMFGRVGGGIFTKAADVGADLAGKVIGVVVDGKKIKLDEDSPYNPACIADNVGDNVGDVAGMGSDLFGSFGEASCAALLVGASSPTIIAAGWNALMFPLFVSATGIVVCLLVSFVATNVWTVKKEEDVETVLKVQLLLTSIGMTAALYPVANAYLPAKMIFDGKTVEALTCYACVVTGLWGGCLIGFITEYYTSASYQPVRDVARSTETGAATNIIYGLSLGYKSAILPVTIISATIYLSLKTAGMYGVALAALGMLSTLSTCLSIDVYGPVCDNAGGIAEMCELDERVRDKTDALDAAGNTTAAIGKGFAIGSAALVSLALFGAFITRASISVKSKTILTIDLLKPVVFAFLVFGAMIPYWFSALTMRSVGEAANAMVLEVADQMRDTRLAKAASMTVDERLKEKELNGPGAVPKPDYKKCIEIATNASLREMIAPGLLVIMSPILCGLFFGVEAVSGLLAGSLASSVQLAISMSNTGGAWDNAKKYCEKGELNGWFAAEQVDAERWKDIAEKNHGNRAVKQGNQDIKSFLNDMEKSNPAKYNAILAGEEPIITTNGNSVKYAGKKSDAHAACVVGDTVGDPLKDTSGPALNIVMKLMAIISVVFADFFVSVNCGNGLSKWGELKCPGK